MHIFSRPLIKPHKLQLLVNFHLALSVGHACKLKPEAHILRHRAPWQQSKLLKDHGHLALPNMPERCLIAGDDINHLGSVAHHHTAARHLVEAVHSAQQRGFARAGKPHQHADLAFLDHKIGPCRPQHRAGLFENFRPALARIKHP